ncbi:unnamed protein product, partial [Iphiclides podalirius]
MNSFHCSESNQDSEIYILAVCSTWQVSTHWSILGKYIARNLILPAVVLVMLSANMTWRAAASFCEIGMVQKEFTERDRENIDLARRRGKRCIHAARNSTQRDGVPLPGTNLNKQRGRSEKRSKSF